MGQIDPQTLENGRLAVVQFFARGALSLPVSGPPVSRSARTCHASGALSPSFSATSV